MTKASKLQSMPKELPPGWEWQHRDKRVPSFRAEKPWTNLRTLTLPSEEDVIRAAYEIEAANQEGLAGLAGKGLVMPSQDVNGSGDELSLEKALLYALNQEDERWEALRQTGAADEVLTCGWQLADAVALASSQRTT